MKKFLGISLIALAALFLRVIFLDKPEGLWNDEYVSWMIAAKPFASGFWSGVKSQCHMPFYYLYLKFFMALFGQSDLVLRLTSVFAGILSVVAMYFVGLQVNKRTAWLCIGFSAISSFLIYFSQEVRLYSVLFLFSALSLLFTIKSIKAPNSKNLILYGISNFLILFTHTIGFVYVFFNLVFLSLNLYKTCKALVIKIWVSIAIGLAFLAPLIYRICTTKVYSQWWGHFSISKIGFLFTDYFSPVLTNITNAPDNFLYAPKLAFFMLVPTIIALICIVKAIVKDKFNLGLFLVCAGTVGVMVIASLAGKLVFLTKYSMEIYPTLILLACLGCTLFTNKFLKYTLVSVFMLINLGYILVFPNSAPNMTHSEGHKLVGDALKSMNLKKGDIIILQYYSKDRFFKYFDFSDYRVISINKGNYQNFLSPKTSYSRAYSNGKELYKPIFLSSSNTYFDNRIKKEVLNRLEPGQSVVTVSLNSVAFYNPSMIYSIVSNEKMYEKVPLLFLIFSYVKNQVFYDIISESSIVDINETGSWTIIRFIKLNNCPKK